MATPIFSVIAAERFESVMAQGLPAGSHWTVYPSMLAATAEAYREEGLASVVLTMDLDALDRDAIAPDGIAAHLLDISNPASHAVWMESGRTWQDSMALLGGVRYERALGPTLLVVASLKHQVAALAHPNIRAPNGGRIDISKMKDTNNMTKSGKNAPFVLADDATISLYIQLSVVGYCTGSNRLVSGTLLDVATTVRGMYDGHFKRVEANWRQHGDHRGYCPQFANGYPRNDPSDGDVVDMSISHIVLRQGGQTIPVDYDSTLARFLDDVVLDHHPDVQESVRAFMEQHSDKPRHVVAGPVTPGNNSMQPAAVTSSHRDDVAQGTDEPGFVRVVLQHTVHGVEAGNSMSLVGDLEWATAMVGTASARCRGVEGGRLLVQEISLMRDGAWHSADPSSDASMALWEAASAEFSAAPKGPGIR